PAPAAQTVAEKKETQSGASPRESFVTHLRNSGRERDFRKSRFPRPTGAHNKCYALRSPLRLASLIPQAFSVDHFGARGRSCQERTFGTIASAGPERSGRDPAKPRQRAPEAAALRHRSTARRPLGGQAPGWISQLLQPPTDRPA